MDIENDLNNISSEHKINISDEINNSVIHQNNEIINNILIYSNNVIKQIGCGFIEYIYHKALLVDLYKTKYNIQTKQILPIYYNNVNVGYVEPDIIVETQDFYIILELKDIYKIGNKERYQIKKYINHTNTSKKIIGVIINFNQHLNNYEKKELEFEIV